MLGKVIKQEWKEIWKFHTILTVVTAAVALLGIVTIQVPRWAGGDLSGFVMTLTGILCLSLFVVYIVGIVAVLIARMLYVAIHFYRSMYSAQGYLTHTLPVTNHELFAGKLLVNAVWMLLGGLATAAGLIGLVMSIGFYLGTDFDLFKLIQEGFSELLLSLGLSDVWLLIRVLASGMIGLFAGIIKIFASITLGQLSAKHKIVFSVVAYMGINTVKQLVSNIISWGTITFSTRNVLAYGTTDFGRFFDANFLLAILLEVSVAVVLYFVSTYIIKNKLNLE